MMANKKWLQSARTKMERKGTVGAFTKHCGGRITNDCIERALNSNNPSLQKQAQFAKNMRKMQPGGFQDPNAMMQPMQQQGVQPIEQQAAVPQLQMGQPTTGPAVEAQAADAQTGQQGMSTDQKVDAASQALSAGGQAAGGEKSIGGGALSGAGKGAAMGATLGSIVPGIGNVIGAGIGAVVGGIGGAVKANKGKKEAAASGAAAQQADLAQRMQDAQTAKYGSFARYYDGGMRYMQDGNFSKESADIKTTFKGQQLPDPKGFEMKGKGATTFQGQKIPATQLPGGVQMPIGYGVDKFIGNKHDQAGNGSPSGIILEEGGKSKPGIEVEDGELNTDVKTTKGKKEYIVSDHVVNPATGNTLAEDMEKEIKAAKSKRQADKIKQKYVKLNEELKEDGKPGMVKAQEGEFTGGALTDEEAGVGKQSSKGGGKFGEATDESIGEMKARNPWYDFEQEGFDPNDQESVLKFQKEYNKRAPEGKKITEDGKYGTQTDSVKLNPGIAQIESKPIQQLEVPGAGEPRGLMLPPEQKKEEAPAEEPAKETPAAKGDPQQSLRLRPTGTMLQALGPAMALREQLTPQKVAPKYIKAPKLGRVNMDRERAEERASAAATGEAASRSMAGPAAFAARQSTAAQSAARQRGISSAEGRENVAISAREKQGEMQASQFNANAYMNAQRTNAATANRAEEMNQANKIAALNQLGKIGTQTVVDRNQQRADIFEGQAGQVDGEFDRALQNYYPGSKLPFGPKVNINPQGGTTMSQQQIDAMYAQQAASEQPPKESARRGRYVKKPGKINRRSRRR